MLKVMEFRRKLKTLKDEGNAILVKTETEKRAMNPEEKARFDAVTAEMDAVEGRMDSYIKINRISEDELKNPEPMKPEGRMIPGASEEERLLSAPMGGFKSGGHFLRDVMRADTNNGMSEELRKWNLAVRTAGNMEEGDGAQGGYLVPVEYSKTLIQKSLETSIVRPRASIQPMASNRITFSADVDKDHSSNYFGGITLYRPGEGGQTTKKNPTYEQIALTLNKVTGLCYVSDELMEDSVIAVEAEVNRKFGQAIAFVEDDDYLNGTGAKMPLGAISSNNPAIVTVTAVSGQGAATIIADNIIDMFARMYPAGAGNAIWIANIETFPQLAKLTLAVGTGGIPVWMPAGGVSGSPFNTLMGRPVIFTEKCQALGTAGDIAFVDFSQYKIGQKTNGIQTASSIHIRFDYGETAFRFAMRYDGTPTWTSALTPKRGSATLSPFVVLSSTRT